MEKVIKIDLINNKVILSNGSTKMIDNYIFELEDRNDKLKELLKEYEDVDPLQVYAIGGSVLFEALDLIENRK